MIISQPRGPGIGGGLLPPSTTYYPDSSTAERTSHDGTTLPACRSSSSNYHSGSGNHQHGERITNGLRTWERDSFPDAWIICGKDEHLCGMGSAQDIVRLAKVILAQFAGNEHQNQEEQE